MKTHLALTLLIGTALMCAGCANEQPQTAASGTKPKNADEIREAEENKPPFIGMTKAQALARYGEPKQQTVTDEGEQWTYLLNFGEVMGKALIPFNFKPTTIRTGTLTFGPDGKVKKFRWDTGAQN